MSSLLFSINAVMPVFLMILLGFIITRTTGLFDHETRLRMNRLVYNYALPAMLYRDIAEIGFQELLDLGLMAITMGATLAVFAASWALAVFFIKDRKSAGVFVQGSFRSNYAIIGLPLVANITGGAGIGKAAVVTAFVIPLYNVLSVVILSIYNDKNGYNGGKPSQRHSVVKASVIGILKNPLIHGICLGLGVSALDLDLPAFLDTTIGYVASITTPIALLSIGASIDFAKMRDRIKPAAAVTIMKLVIWPLIFVSLAALFGMRGERLAVIYVMIASPTAIVSYILAQNMGGDEYLASNIVLLTTLCSVLTFTFGVFILKSLVLI